MKKLFNDRTKEDAVRDVLSGKTTAAARAKGLKIHINTLYRWKEEYLAKNGKPEPEKAADHPLIATLLHPDMIEVKLTELRAEIHILEQAQRILNSKA